MADIDRVDEGLPIRQPLQADHAVGGSARAWSDRRRPPLPALSTLSIRLDQVVDAEWDGGDRITPRNWKPEKTRPKAGSAPKAEARERGVQIGDVQAPRLKPNRLSPGNQRADRDSDQAGRDVHGIFEAPNQLTMMMAKQVNPITGVMKFPAPGAWQ